MYDINMIFTYYIINIRINGTEFIFMQVDGCNYVTQQEIQLFFIMTNVYKLVYHYFVL